MATAREQPPWQQPAAPKEGVQIPPLTVYNSLTRSKNPFIPLDPAGKRVTWYACGPTVYDDAHLGHARNYVTTDILRRIMRDYFQFDMEFVMNITDVDDKIILRGRQQHLFDEYQSKQTIIDDEVISFTATAFTAFVKKNLALVAENVTPDGFLAEAENKYWNVLRGKAMDGGEKPGDRETKIKMHLKTATTAATALVEARSTRPDRVGFFTKTQDVLFPYLDALHGSELDTSDHSIFTKLTKKFEDRFTEDVRRLNCLDPDRLTRVTEYGPQIVDFVKKIEENKFGYATSDGSVYFDIEAFEKGGNNYARLEPWNTGNVDLRADGEGALTKKTSEKRSDADFALWKTSKPGEPWWDSPWGKGRPGWHIECSAMASDVLGGKIDIHSGGIDLAFPHHDNELAQSEAYWLEKEKSHTHGDGTHQWINYFFHMGHLSISGSKMSKSLKNYITIREALDTGDYTVRSLRIIFLLGSWKDGVEITDDLRKASDSWEDKVNNFFLKAQDLQRNPRTDAPNVEQDNALLAALSKAQTDLDLALCDSFDTFSAMQAISALITEYNIREKESVSMETILSAARWITKIVTTFGLNGNASVDDINTIGWTGVSIPEIAQPFVYAASELRDEVRKRAIAGDVVPNTIKELASRNKAEVTQPADAIPYAEALSQFQEDVTSLSAKDAPAKDYLALCDRLRDVSLWDLDIYLEDREGQRALVRPVDKQLKAERAVKAERERAKKEAREKKEREDAEKAAKKAEQAKISHLDMFRTAEYTAWDDEGLPLRDAKGEEVPKSRSKKLKKEWTVQKRLHEEYLKTQ